MAERQQWPLCEDLAANPCRGPNATNRKRGSSVVVRSKPPPTTLKVMERMWGQATYQAGKLKDFKGLHLNTGGEGGIRTHGEVAPTAVFKTAALDRSATSPARCVIRASVGMAQAGVRVAEDEACGAFQFFCSQ